MLEPIKLRLVKNHTHEVVCDQYGRPLDGVISVSYEIERDGMGSILTLRLRPVAAKWDLDIGASCVPKSKDTSFFPWLNPTVPAPAQEQS